MTYGTTIGGVSRSRFNAGENTTGFAKRAQPAELAQVPTNVTVEAALDRTGKFVLTVTANGDSATVSGVKAADLADRIADLVFKVSKALRNGDLTKSRPRDSSPFGLGTPRSNRENLRFG